MKECKRCGKKNVDIHTCTPLYKAVSTCCGKDVKVSCGDAGGIGSTYWWECQECRKPCDVT